jgi:hypothetical protein
MLHPTKDSSQYILFSSAIILQFENCPDFYICYLRKALLNMGSFTVYSTIFFQAARGGVVVKALRYKPAGRGSIPEGVTGIFR